jgi:hypothetical protein
VTPPVAIAAVAGETEIVTAGGGGGGGGGVLDDDPDDEQPPTKLRIPRQKIVPMKVFFMQILPAARVCC